jgi:general secretion pathway protein K
VADRPMSRSHALVRPRALLSCYPRHRSPGPDRRQAGFALVTVVWSIGLISLLGIAVMVGARYRNKTTMNVASYQSTAVAAESAINLAIVRTLAASPGHASGLPLQCRMPGGEFVTVSIENEAGKVDLNTAAPAVLVRLFSALTHDQVAGNRIAERIIVRRGSPSRQGSPEKTASLNQKPAFTTILQLDQIEGISPKLLHAALPLVTVRSGRTTPDEAAVSPALRQVLELSQTASAPPSAPASSEVTIRADVTAAHGARFVREALVTIGAQDGKPFVIHEWRRGDLDQVSPLSNDSAVPSKDCLQITARAAAD